MTEKFLIGDINVELITTYKIIKKCPMKLIESLKERIKKHSREYYEMVINDPYTNNIEQS